MLSFYIFNIDWGARGVDEGKIIAVFMLKLAFNEGVQGILSTIVVWGGRYF